MSQQFEQLSLSNPLLRAITDAGYTEPTAIQQKAIPDALAGRDILATARTGTGKTAAFSLPLLQLLESKPISQSKKIRALVLTPTRELALQIDESLRTYGKHLDLRHAVILGGVPQGKQIKALAQRPEILVATPGRLLDLFNQGRIRLDGVEMFVLDEADRMLDMGFINDVRRVVKEIPKKRQTMFFSATMSKEIAKLASSILTNPITIEVEPSASVSTDITQTVLFVQKDNKRKLLTHLLQENKVTKGIIFTRTKHRANRIARQLCSDGVKAVAMHSNKSQNARQKALSDFDRGKVTVLVATDIVSRGIDVDGISHVINYELPNESEAYVHRIGRTARAGAVGVAFSMCDAEEVAYLRDIEKLTKQPLISDDEHPYYADAIAATRNTPVAAPRKARNARGGSSRGPRRRGPQRGSGRGSRNRTVH